MPAPRPCPDSVVRYGAMLIDARRHAYLLRMKLQAMDTPAETALADLKRAGAKEMEVAQGRALLLEAAKAEFIIGQAHDCFRKVLGAYGFAEPTDAQINAILGSQVTPQGIGGGGGGGRGGR